MKRIKIRPLQFGLKEKGGRNLIGQITAPRRNALVKRTYRYLDTKRFFILNEGATLLIPYIYDPNRTGYISLIILPNGIITYILAPEYKKNQQKIYNLININNYNENIGASQLLQNFKNGSSIFNCELYASNGSKILRSAGVSGIILKKLSKINTRIIIKLKSGALRAIPANGIACLGQTSNANHFLRKKKKAGQTRLQGKRPHTRPSAMNPVDHPMGGRTKGGIHPQNANGLLNGTPTAKKKNHKLQIRSARLYRLKKKKKI